MIEGIGCKALFLDPLGLEPGNEADDAGGEEGARHDDDDQETLVPQPVPGTGGALGCEKRNHPTASITRCQDGNRENRSGYVPSRLS